MADPQYVVRAMRFHCGDESGIDWTGSDEPVWIFTANDETSAEIETRASRKYSDIDTGDTVEFDMDNDNIVWPQSANAQGAPGPIGLSIQLWETDQGNADRIKERTKQVLNVAAWVPVVGQWCSKVPSQVPDLIGVFAGDDIMGSQTIVYSTRRLRRRYPNVGDRAVEKLHFSGGNGDIPFGLAGSPDYDLYLEITRVS